MLLGSTAVQTILHNTYKSSFMGVMLFSEIVYWQYTQPSLLHSGNPISWKKYIVLLQKTICRRNEKWFMLIHVEEMNNNDR